MGLNGPLLGQVPTILNRMLVEIRTKVKPTTVYILISLLSPANGIRKPCVLSGTTDDLMTPHYDKRQRLSKIRKEETGRVGHR